MRVTSALWVAAYVRRAFVEGGFAAVTRRGAQEAGAIFVVVDQPDGSVDLYGQAPQSAFGADRPADRLFTLVESGLDRGAPRRADRRRDAVRPRSLGGRTRGTQRPPAARPRRVI